MGVMGLGQYPGPYPHRAFFYWRRRFYAADPSLYPRSFLGIGANLGGLMIPVPIDFGATVGAFLRPEPLPLATTRKTMNPWDTVRSTINNHPREDPSWRSQRESLMRILAKAEEWGIDPANALNVQISAWSTIILEAKRAVRWEQPLFLAEIFRLAATLPVSELRLALHVSDIDEINVVQSGDQFMLVLSQPQFERVQRSTRARHVYRVKPATTFANDPGGFRDGLRQLQTRS